MSQILDSQLSRFYDLLSGENITEVSFNGNKIKKIFIEQNGSWFDRDLKDLIGENEEVGYLNSIFTQLASYNGQPFDSKNPILSGVLPKGHRIQVVHESCVGGGNKAFSIRKPSEHSFTFDDYINGGAFDNVKIDGQSNTDDDIYLDKLLNRDKNVSEFIKQAVILKKNIIISGGTGSGKTTFFNALTKLIPLTERLISIEDTPELKFIQTNCIYLISPENNKSINFNTLLRACLRLRPDRIMAAEIRGEEAFSYLRAINTGHSGSITTIHANNASSAFHQLYMMLSQANLNMDQDAVMKYVRATVDVIVQMKNKKITEIWFRGINDA